MAVVPAVVGRNVACALVRAIHEGMSVAVAVVVKFNVDEPRNCHTKVSVADRSSSALAAVAP